MCKINFAHPTWLGFASLAVTCKKTDSSAAFEMIAYVLRDRIHEIRDTNLEVSFDEAGVEFVFDKKIV